MSKHITVGFDGSPEAVEALRWGAHEAKARGCGVEIVTCFHLPVASDVHAGWVPLEAYGQAEQAASAQLERAREGLRVEHPELMFSTELRAGPPGGLLVEQSGSDQEMIVVGASSHRGASAFWLGSTPRAVVAVHLVRGDEDCGRDARQTTQRLQHVDGAGAVGGEGGRRFALAAADEGLRCQVQHQLRPRFPHQRGQ